MFAIRKYRVGFDGWGLLLFLAVMAPNIIWFLTPAPTDILRNFSATPGVDRVASVLQVIMVAAVCGLRNDTCKMPMAIGWRGSVAFAALLYFAGWLFYYAGATNIVVIMDLCIAPCVAFILFALARRNGVALTAAVAFLVCHGYYGVVNFVL